MSVITLQITGTEDDFKKGYDYISSRQIEFETYLQKAITVMTEHLDEFEFEKDHRGTITGYKSHSISDEVLDKLMPWNMAQKQ